MSCKICKEDKKTNGKGICDACRCKVYRRENFFKDRLYLVKKRADKNNIPFNLTTEYIKSIWTGICGISGHRLNMDDYTSEDAPQLDKIIPSKGYIIGNVCWLSAKYNRLKSDLELSDAELITEWLRIKN